MSWIRGPRLWVKGGRKRHDLILVVRKSLGTAVIRNRLKRRLRAAVADCHRPVRECLIILPQPAATHASFKDLRDELAALLIDLQSS